MLKRRLFSLALLCGANLAIAHEFNHGNVYVLHPWVRATAPGQPSAALYLTLDNRGPTAEALTGITTPAAASAAVHTMSMRGDVMQMRAVSILAVPARSKVAMAPGDGYHIMLTGLRGPLKVGQKIPLQLRFKHASLPITAVVEAQDHQP